jgi:hypothetical protein|tara:strand:+ start:1023 stop:1517 length:495 start_codon:yes stop_codon:yes gene_type:complete
MHIEVLEEIDHLKVLEEANTVKVMLDKGWANIGQVGIQGHKPDLDPLKEWGSSIGRVNKLQYPETYFKYSLFELPIINRLMEKYGMLRTRIMQSNPKTCLTLHQDMTKRIHIPLITNEDCFMVIENKNYILEVGKVYLTNTTLRHTAVNASKQSRVHIVGCMYG